MKIESFWLFLCFIGRLPKLCPTYTHYVHHYPNCAHRSHIYFGQYDMNENQLFLRKAHWFFRIKFKIHCIKFKKNLQSWNSFISENPQISFDKLNYTQIVHSTLYQSYSILLGYFLLVKMIQLGPWLRLTNKTISDIHTFIFSILPSHHYLTLGTPSK